MCPWLLNISWVSLTLYRHWWGLFRNHIPSPLLDDIRAPQATKGGTELCSKSVWVQDQQAMMLEFEALIGLRVHANLLLSFCLEAFKEFSGIQKSPKFITFTFLYFICSEYCKVMCNYVKQALSFNFRCLSVIFSRTLSFLVV